MNSWLLECYDSCNEFELLRSFVSIVSSGCRGIFCLFDSELQPVAAVVPVPLTFFTLVSFVEGSNSYLTVTRTYFLLPKRSVPSQSLVPLSYSLTSCNLCLSLIGGVRFYDFQFVGLYLEAGSLGLLQVLNFLLSEAF